MKSILIFDNVNDLIFSKWDDTFIERLKSFVQQENNGEFTDSYTVSQLLSPIITSQRVMAAQFGNTYASMQCKDGTNIVFEEWLDHILMIVSEDKIDDAHRELLDCKTLVQNICGQNIGLLHSPIYREWLSVLLESRERDDSVPGVSGVIGESGATSAALNALKTIPKHLKSSLYQSYHLMLFVGDKLLSLYSSRGSEDLSPPDLILIGLHCIAAQKYWSNTEKAEDKRTSIGHRLPWLSVENSAIVYMCAGASSTPCAPHALHIAQVTTGIALVLLFDLDLREISVPTQVSIQMLFNLKKILLQRNLELLPATIDSLDAAIKKTMDALRKNKANMNICNRLANKMADLRKCCTTTTPLTPETAATALLAAIHEVTELLEPEIPSVKNYDIMRELREKLAPYFEFLRVKAERHFSLGSSGRDSYEDNAIGYVQVKRLNGQCTIKARVTPEHKVRATAYHCTFICNESENNIESVECEGCPASKGGCKHTIALVMWLHRRSEEPACTEVACYWKKPKLSEVGSQIKFIKAKDMGNTRKSHFSATPSTCNGIFLKSVIEKSTELKIESQIMTYFSPINDMYKVSMHYLINEFRKKNGVKDADSFILFCKENIRSEQCDAIERATRSQADCRLWHEMRYARITASKVHESAQCGTPDGVLVEYLLGAYKFKETFAVKRGKLLENSVCEEVSIIKNIKFKRVGLILSQDFPFMGASPDGILGEECILEIKCPVSNLNFKNYVNDNGVVAKKYYAQMQTQMFFTKKKKCLFCIAHENFESTKKLDIYEIKYDKDYCENLFKKCEKFWKENIFKELFQ